MQLMIYGSREGGFTVEIGWTGRIDGDNVTLGDVIEVVLQDNYFLDIGVAHDHVLVCKSN